MENLELKLILTVQQVNVILKYLGGGAYAEVADIVAKIKDDAAPQLIAAQKIIEDSNESQEAA